MLPKSHLTLTVSTTTNHCPIGETVGNDNLAQAKTPVLSCEGACIRGEIARQAANLVARHPNFGRACHGELFAVPDSAIARWVKTAKQVILIDGCFLRCHGRILENMVGKDQLVQFDALSFHKKYSEIFDPEEVPDHERRAVAQRVAEWVLNNLCAGTSPCCAPTCDTEKSNCCG